MRLQTLAPLLLSIPLVVACAAEPTARPPGAGRHADSHAAGIEDPRMVEELRAVERARLEAMVAADAPALERMLGDELQYGHSTGVLHTKPELIALLASGKLDYLALRPRTLDVRAHAGTALLSGIVEVEANAGPRHLAAALRFLAAYARRDGRWQLVAYQSAAIQN
jgi:hypothetical protein